MFIQSELRGLKTFLILGFVILIISSCVANNGNTKADPNAWEKNQIEQTSQQEEQSDQTTGDNEQVDQTTGQKEQSDQTGENKEQPGEKANIPTNTQLLPGGYVYAGDEKKSGIYYEIFVRSFADSDHDGIGDLRGLTACLDYLNDGDSGTDTDLGVDGIYLMPVNSSSSYHGYDVTDYYDIDADYGTLDDFRVFLEEAHRRNIRVIMDLVVNHTGKEHEWFREASKSRNNPYRSYYNWADENTVGIDVKSLLSSGIRIWHPHGDAWYYGYFWDGMPDLNYDTPAVREEIKNAARFWLEQGVDGFRLDAAMHIYSVGEKPLGTRLTEKSIAWWQEFREAAEQVNPHVYLVAEVWDTTHAMAPYYQAFDSLFNFDVGEGIINTLRSGSALAVSSKGFSRWLLEKYEAFANVRADFIDAPFLTNHDQNRIMDRLGGDNAKAKLAAGMLMTLPGNPFLYYGEEIGMRGSKPDEKIRVPFKWFEEAKAPQCSWQSILNNFSTIPEEVQRTDPESLLSYYKSLIKVRHSSDALMKGGFEPVDSGNRAVVAWSRSFSSGETSETVVVFHNVSAGNQKVALSGIDCEARVVFKSVRPDTWDEDQKPVGQEMELAPLSTVILRRP